MSNDKVKELKACDSIRMCIVERMESQQLTAWHLAKISGLKYDTVRRFVSGTHDTTTDKASLMLEALQVGWPDWYKSQFTGSDGKLHRVSIKNPKNTGRKKA